MCRLLFDCLLVAYRLYLGIVSCNEGIPVNVVSVGSGAEVVDIDGASEVVGDAYDELFDLEVGGCEGVGFAEVSHEVSELHEVVGFDDEEVGYMGVCEVAVEDADIAGRFELPEDGPEFVGNKLVPLCSGHGEPLCGSGEGDNDCVLHGIIFSESKVGGGRQMAIYLCK